MSAGPVEGSLAGSSESIGVSLPASLGSARLGRIACRPLLPLVGDRGDDLELLITELVTNGVRHPEVEGENSIWLGVVVGSTHVRVEVIDRGTGFVPPTVPDRRPRAGGGWGLVLVGEICDDWGVFEDGGTHVWGNLPLNGASA